MTLKTLLTTRGLLYSYTHLTPSSPNGKCILFLHGFPSSAHDWRHQVEFFSKKGYGVIVPDLLGYGGTAKPTTVDSYRGKAMAKDVKEILEKEGVNSVLGVGHDWGSFLLSKLVNYYPETFEKLVFIDVGYSLPGRNLTFQTVSHINSSIQHALGFSIFGYFLFFAEPDAAALLDAHSDSARSLFYSNNAEIGKQYMGAPGGFRTWLEADMKAESQPWFTAQDQFEYEKAFAGGYAAPICWYKAQLEDVNAADDETIPQENQQISPPTLLLSSATNFITTTADMGEVMKPVFDDLKVEKVDAGHWIQIEKPDRVNELLVELFER